MKGALLFFMMLIASCLFNSCTKDKALPPVSVTCLWLDTSSNTYNFRIGAIIETNCGSARGCHDASNYAISGGNVPIYDYTTTKDAFQNRKGLCAIKHEIGCISMPYTPFPQLADSLIKYIQCWTENGCPE